jgi:UDP-N-acetylmuramate-alanine ligase
MRRRIFQEELAAALGEADQVVIGKPFSPPSHGETLDPHKVVGAIRRAQGDAAAIYLEDPEEIIAHCVAGASPGDVIVVMSSGHFENLPQRICTALREHS